MKTNIKNYRGSEYYNKCFIKDKYKTLPHLSKYYSLWNEMFSLLRYQIENRNKKTNNVILDLGCGSGQFGFMASERGYKYIGFDFSKNAIKVANKLMKSCIDYELIYKNIEKEISNILKNNFDYVIMSEFLEHLKNDLNIIRNIQRNKIVVFSVPNFECIGHVRWFSNINDVLKRYQKFFNKIVVVTFSFEKFHIINKKHLKKVRYKFFIVSGVRNGRK